MNIHWPHTLLRQPRVILDEAGYHEFTDPKTLHVSYVMRIGQLFYPRYHVYVNKHDASGTEIDIHIDQKQASYEGHAAHSGEYDGPLVEEEVARIQRWFTYYSQPQK